MKIKFVSLAIISLALSACAPAPHSSADFASEHNARISLDWAGTYRGVLPCADCEGIKTVVTLDANGTYQTQSQYLGKGDDVSVEKGAFTWSAAGNTIMLGKTDPEQYFVGENRLIRLAMDGSRITGAIADRFILLKDAGVK